MTTRCNSPYHPTSARVTTGDGDGQAGAHGDQAHPALLGAVLPGDVVVKE